MKIALTFDIERDIPHLIGTYFGVKVGLLRILRILDNYNIKATFFCTGNIAKHLPEHIKLIEKKGHEIACHSLNHERLDLLDYEKCYDIIYQNKKIIEDTCQNSEIIGFRAPRLKPPKFLFEILNKLGFKYDSSINSRQKLKYNHINKLQIKEFYTSNYSIYFRFPMSSFFLQKRIFKSELTTTILVFHPWEAINMRNIYFTQTNALCILKNLFFRPDRVGRTGNKFLKALNGFIEKATSRKAEFVQLKQLMDEKII